MSLPTLSFGRWTKWAARAGLRHSPPHAGVYPFGDFRCAPTEPPTAERLPVEVIYVGDSKNLNYRLFSNPHHKVDERYPERFPEDPNRELLYVSACQLYPAPSISDTEHAVKYARDRTLSVCIEFCLAWRYTQVHEHPPVMQVKRGPSNQCWIDPVLTGLKTR